MERRRVLKERPFALLRPVNANGVDLAGSTSQLMRRRSARHRRSGGILIVRASEGAEPAAGVMKLNGKLVPLAATEGGDLASLATGVIMAAEGVRMAVRPSPEEGSVLGGLLQRSNAELVFELEQGLTVGYRGFYTCDI